MRSGLILALAASLAVGAPAIAQNGAPAQAPVSPDAGIDAAAQAFRAQVEAMNAEVRTAVQTAGSNRRRASSQVEEILARYQPGFESFAVQLEAWFSQRAAAATDEARASVVQTGAASVARVRGVPDQVRAGLAQRAQARAIPEQPRNTQPSMGY